MQVYMCECVGVEGEKGGIEVEEGREGKKGGLKKRGLGICVCLLAGALRRARVRSGCAVSDRNHRGSQNKLRGRTHTRRIHTHREKG